MKKNTFKNNLRQAREEKGLSQTDMANALCLNVTTYRNYENTDREPDYDTLISISQILDIPVDKLLQASNDNEKVYPPIIQLENDESILLENYRILSEQSKGKLQERAKILLEDETIYSKRSV